MGAIGFQSLQATGTGTHRVQSGLVRACLGRGGRGSGESRRGLVWVNSLCGAVLLVGLVGLKEPAAPWVPVAAPVEAPVVPVEFQPPATSASVEMMASRAADSEPVVADPATAPVVEPVAAVSLPELVPFAVPVAGPVREVREAAMAAAPTPRQADAAATAQAATAPVVASGGEARAFRPGDGAADGIQAPHPDYPAEAERRQISGTVKLEIEVTASGAIGEVRKLVPSGSVVLDNHTVGWVKRRWKFPPGRRQLLHTEFVYELSDRR